MRHDTNHARDPPADPRPQTPATRPARLAPSEGNRPTHEGNLRIAANPDEQARPLDRHLRAAVDPDEQARPLDAPLRIAVDPDEQARPLDHNLRIAVDPDDQRRPFDGMLRIAVDFDGVLFDHIPYVLRGFRDAHGIDLQAEGLRYWDFFQYRAVREKNLTWNCVREVLEAIDTDPVLHEMPPRDGSARDVMQAWMDQGHRVSIVTARDPRARVTTEAFLRRNDIPHHELRMGAAIKTGYDVLVDDAPHNVLMAAADGGLALLMDHPYNRDVPTRRNPLRVHDWLEVAACLARHLETRAEVPA